MTTILDFLLSDLAIMIFITAVVFTIVGRYMKIKTDAENIIGATIDSLIEDGYLKTRGVGREMEILKHTEWCEKDVDT